MIHEELKEYLLTFPVYGQDTKMVDKALDFLERIAEFIIIEEKDAADTCRKPEEYVEVHCSVKANYFGNNYNQYIQPLLDSKILICDGHYRTSKDFGIGNEKCLGYKLDLTADPLLAIRLSAKIRNEVIPHAQYMNILRVRACMRKKEDTTPCQKHTERTHDLATYDIDYIEEYMNREGWTDKQKMHTLHSLHKLKKEKYTAKSCESNLRIHTILVRLPKVIRDVIQIDHLPATHIIDIKACHPQLLGLYISSMSNRKQVKEEAARWTAFWTDPDVSSPRDKLARILLGKNWENHKAAFKEMLVMYINGRYHTNEYTPEVWTEVDKLNWNKLAYVFTKHMKKEFPAMYACWLRTNLHDTSCAVSRMFEVPIMQASEIYNYCNDNKIYFSLEHDGGTLYGGSRRHAEAILTILKTKSKEITGVEVKFKCEGVNA